MTNRVLSAGRTPPAVSWNEDPITWEYQTLVEATRWSEYLIEQGQISVMYSAVAEDNTHRIYIVMTTKDWKARKPVSCFSIRDTNA